MVLDAPCARTGRVWITPIRGRIAAPIANAALASSASAVIVSRVEPVNRMLSVAQARVQQMVSAWMPNDAARISTVV